MVRPEPGAGWSPRRIGGPVVVVAGSVVVGWVVVGSALVVGSSVVVGSTVLVGAVVLGSMVVVGAVTVGSVVVAPPDVDGAPVVVVRPTLAGTPVVADRAVVAGPLAATRAVSGVLVDGVREVLGSRGRVVVVNADVGVGLAGKVDSAAPLCELSHQALTACA
jgi:NDP-sugar pyrophosphorylase family protein